MSVSDGRNHGISQIYNALLNNFQQTSVDKGEWLFQTVNLLN